VIAKHLEATGLSGNAEFLTAFERVLQETATKPIWNFFTAYDGEGSFDEDLVVEMTTSDGERIPHYLHEVMWSAGKDYEGPNQSKA
jgi:hypothetical protein